MIKLFITFVFFCLQLNFANAIEIKCEFEEVYTDGSTQIGFFLIKDKNMRYEYFDKNLYVIFKYKNNFFLVEKKDTEKFQKIPDDRNFILNTIADIANDYPNINEIYEYDDLTIKIEKNNDNFFKRIAIISNDLALSIYINNCNQEKIEDKFFYYFPYFVFQ